MERDMTRLLVEATVRRALKEAKDSPAREARNLVDLGVHFSQGRFQSRLFSVMQRMLCDEKSAYYALIKDTLGHIDQNRLLTFGVNLGYEGCTKGAKTIRQIEADEGMNIPWALSLQISGAKLADDPTFYASVFRQGEELGIHTYLLYSKDLLRPLIPTLQERATSAFILCPTTAQVTESFIACLQAVPNVMVAVRWEAGAAEACQRLREAQIPYSVLWRYAEADRETILSGKWVSSVLPMHPIFAFLYPDSACSQTVQQEIYQYVLSVREAQKHPVLLMDVKQDILLIDQIISGDVCAVGFDSQGVLYTHLGCFPDASCNLFQNSLRNILRRALKKGEAAAV